MVSNLAMQKNVGAWLKSAAGSAITDLTAGGGGDNTEVDGVAIDRQVLGALGPALSAKVVLTFEAVLAAAATLSLVANIQDADDNGSDAPGSWADFGSATEVLASGVVATGPGGGGNVKGTAEIDVNLQGARRWVRVQFTPNLSAANTDTAEVVATWILAGYPANPA